MGELCERCGMVDSDAGSALCMFCEKETPAETCAKLRDQIAMLQRELNEARKHFIEIAACADHGDGQFIYDIAEQGKYDCIMAIGGEAEVDRIED